MGTLPWLLTDFTKKTKVDLAGFCLCLESARTLKIVKRFRVYGTELIM